MKKFYSPHEVARHLPITPDTLKAYCRRGQIQATKPFSVIFYDKTGPSILGPYIAETFSDKNEAIRHAEDLLGMTFDWAQLIRTTIYRDMQIVWTSEGE